MDYKAILKAIKKILLSTEGIKLASAKAGDVTFFADAFEVGQPVFVQNEDGEYEPAPAGTYSLDNGITIVIDESGVITEVTKEGAEPEKMGLSKKQKKEFYKLIKEVQEKLTKQSQTQKKNKKPAGDPPKKGKTKLNKQNPVEVPRMRSQMTMHERIALAMQQTPMYTDVKLATQTNITTTYAGEFAGQYIAAAILQGNTLGKETITVKPNVKHKLVLKKVDISDIIAAGTCDFTPTGTIDLTEAILQPEEMQVNLELCKKDFRGDWEAVQMGYGAFDVLPPNFTAFLLQRIAELVNESMEVAVWTWDKSQNGQYFDGLFRRMKIGAQDGAKNVEGDPITKDNVLDAFESVLAEAPAAVVEKPDFKFWVTAKVAKAYRRALGGFGTNGMGAAGVNGRGMLGSLPLDYSGYPIEVIGATSNHAIVAGQKSNLFFGTGLKSDLNEVKILDMAELDGSDNVRVVMRFTGDTQVVYPNEVAIYTETSQQ